MFNTFMTFDQLVFLLPLLTAILTFILTSIFTVYRERKMTNYSRRIFFEYAEYLLEYPIKHIVHGEGKVLLGDNGRLLNNHAKKYDGATYSFMILKNLTENNAINVKVQHKMSNRLKRQSNPEKFVNETFFMPIWKWNDTLYLPATIYGDDNIYSTNEELIIIYSTSSFEKFKYSLIRKNDGGYKEKLKKRYFGFVWITKVNYYKGSFYNFINVRKN